MRFIWILVLTVVVVVALAYVLLQTGGTTLSDQLLIFFTNLQGRTPMRLSFDQFLMAAAVTSVLAAAAAMRNWSKERRIGVRPEGGERDHH